MRAIDPLCLAALLAFAAVDGTPLLAAEHATTADLQVPDLPDKDLVAAYRHAALQNVLAAVNPKIFPGYFCVCADGQGFGYGFSYPSLDGHQMCDALLWLGQTDTVRHNWDYVRSFQQPDGRLPLAILPPLAGQPIGPAGSQATVAANGGLYEHWVPGNPLAALASPTYIQNADVIYRHTLDRQWLGAQIDSVNLAADYLATLTTAEGVVRGAGYYVERPTRIESDGVAQCHAIDAFRRIAALNRVLGKEEAALGYEGIADRIRSYFTGRFWKEGHFAEYLHPTRGLIASHGLTDVDWAALATDVALPGQAEELWPQLRSEAAFYYGGMPTGISTRPGSYEDWEFSHPDRHDLAAMGRVWYLEAWARYRHQDAAGLLDGLHRVAAEGQKNDYFWRERYYPSSTDSTVPAGAEKYCEYPANFLRIVNRFLLGIDLRLDGSMVVAPCVSDAWWRQGFGHTLKLPDGTLQFRLQADKADLTWSGKGPKRVGIHLPGSERATWRVTVHSGTCDRAGEGDPAWFTLAPAADGLPARVSAERQVFSSDPILAPAVSTRPAANSNPPSQRPADLPPVAVCRPESAKRTSESRPRS